MTENFYLARQAIVDNNEAILGYELLYRDSDKEANIDNPRHATSSLLSNVLNQSGLTSIVGSSLAFVNVDYSFLQHDFIESIPPKTFVFELSVEADIKGYLQESVERLHNKKYVFSIDVSSMAELELVKQLSPYLFFVKIDVMSFEKEKLRQAVKELKELSLIVIASKVEDEETFTLCKEAGCDAYQGYFFAHPKLIKDKKLNTQQMTLFKLCNVLQMGSSIPEIVEAFEEAPTISMQLLRFINSAAFHFKHPISSIHQVVTLLGRNHLVQWLMLLLYSKSFSANVKYQDQLIVMVKQRTLIMVNLLKLIKKNSSQKEQSEAYFVGILSLMNALSGVPLKEILEEFHVDHQVEEALFDQKGFLGGLYDVVLAVENFDTTVLENFIEEHNIDKLEFETLMLDVFKDAIEFETAQEN
jgi:EAL and modified HD-GYP domain-containing signal transduction protein